MNCLDKKWTAGRHPLVFTLPFICVAAFFIIAGCRFPALLRGDVENPHLKGKCNLCHNAPPELLLRVEKGDGEGADLEAARGMKSDLNGICMRCHEPGGGDHAIGEVPEMNRNNLPLDAEGKITCAITCHDVHTKNIDNPAVINGLLRLPQTELCLSCHDK